MTSLNPVETIYVIPALTVAFLTTTYLVKWWIVKAGELGFTGRDMNKPGERLVAEAGGVWVSIGAGFGILMFIAMNKYMSLKLFREEDLMALALLLFLASFLGFLDDLLGWKKGIRAIYRVILMFPLSIPLVVIKAGYSKLAIPFIGVVDLGLLYPLVLVPIGILGASNAFNMIAGYNGLEALQGFILMFYTALFSYINGIHPVFEASLIMAIALLAFLKYNWYPARVFPGNSLTYGVGAYYASLVIIGNFEKYGVLLFTPYFIEFLLFIRGLRHGVYKENFGIPDQDGYLKPPYDRVYSLTHLAIKIQLKVRGRATEKGVVATIALIQILVGALSLVIIGYI